MATHIQNRRDTAAQWTTTNPVLEAGEWGIELDSGQGKLGDGTAAWADLDYSAVPFTVILAAITDAVTAGISTSALSVSATGGGKETIHSANASGANTINLDDGNVFVRTLTGNATFTFTNATNGKACSMLVLFTQDATGGRTVTLPVSVVWAGGFAPVLGSLPGAITAISFVTLDGGATWIGFGSTLPTNVALGYALLDAAGYLAPARLGANTPDNTKFLRGDETWQLIPNLNVPWSMDGTIYVKVGTKRYYVERAYTIVGVRFTLGTAPTGAAAVVDINKNGTTIFTTQGNRPSVAIGANTSGLVTNADVNSLASGDYIGVDMDVVGSTIAGADATVQMILRPS